MLYAALWLRHTPLFRHYAIAAYTPLRHTIFFVADTLMFHDALLSPPRDSPAAR